MDDTNWIPIAKGPKEVMRVAPQLGSLERAKAALEAAWRDGSVRLSGIERRNGIGRVISVNEVNTCEFQGDELWLQGRPPGYEVLEFTDLKTSLRDIKRRFAAKPGIESALSEADRLRALEDLVRAGAAKGEQFGQKKAWAFVKKNATKIAPLFLHREVIDMLDNVVKPEHRKPGRPSSRLK
jgi:hypothetical protein